MNLKRKTYVEVNCDNLKNNVNKIINKYNNYEYYFGVVKADCYGHGIKCVSSVIEGGANYLAVATLDEALEIRGLGYDIPILCLGVIPLEFVCEAISNNVTITISSLDYAKKLLALDINFDKLKVHIKINTGMNRLGIYEKDEFLKCYLLLKNSDVIVEGVFTHIYNALDNECSHAQFDRYNYMIDDDMKDDIPIFHIAASDAMVCYDKPDFVNGARLGIIMYGFTPDKDLNLDSTFCLRSTIVHINELKKGFTVGYNGIYTALGDEKIGVVPIGYADGIIRKNTGRYVYINDKKYEIVGNVCMDMLFVKIDDDVCLGDDVYLLRDIEHIDYTADYLETIVYEVMCSIGKRVPRIYI